MAQFYGKIGYVLTSEDPNYPSKWVKTTTERYYRGTTKRDNRTWSDSSDSSNGRLAMSTEISVVADKFALENIGYLTYVEYMGCKWTVTRVDTNGYPRLTLTLGGLYNGS